MSEWSGDDEDPMKGLVQFLKSLGPEGLKTLGQKERLALIERQHEMDMEEVKAKQAFDKQALVPEFRRRFAWSAAIEMMKKGCPFRQAARDAVAFADALLTELGEQHE